MTTLTNNQARQFLLLKHGLLGEYKFSRKQGVLDFIRQVGCIQYDPVDVCGRNADIVLHSRVQGYTKAMLGELLYRDRQLIDHFDKNLAIFAMEDFPAILQSQLSGGYAEAYDRQGGLALERIKPLLRQLIEERGHISAQAVGVDETIDWHWGISASLPRAALESMYFRGELIIHHKTGTNKSYAFIKDHIPAEILSAAPPFETADQRLIWQIKRRIGSVGMLWNRASDAWLGLRLKAAERTAAFQKMLADGTILELAVDDLKEPFYIQADDRAILETVLREERFLPRAELIAPLDNLIWDRKLIKALFGFEYTWEIYTPVAKRKYGAYVLPLLYGEQFIGRVEAVCERQTQTLIVKNIWYEDGVKQTKKLLAAVTKCLKRFAKFNGCDIIQNRNYTNGTPV